MRWDTRSYSKHQGRGTAGLCAGSEDEMGYKVMLQASKSGDGRSRGTRWDMRSYSKHQGDGTAGLCAGAGRGDEMGYEPEVILQASRS